MFDILFGQRAVDCMFVYRNVSTNPAAKSIVFSQWDKMLAIVHTALEHNRVRCIRPGAGGKSGRHKFQECVAMFRTDETLSVRYVLVVVSLLTPVIQCEPCVVCCGRRCCCFRRSVLVEARTL